MGIKNMIKFYIVCERFPIMKIMEKLAMCYDFVMAGCEKGGC